MFLHGAVLGLGAGLLEGVALATYEGQAEVLLHTDVESAAEEVAPTVGTLTAVDGGTLLRIGANELDWIARFLASLPFDCEIRNPPELRDEMRALARRCVAMASRA